MTAKNAAAASLRGDEEDSRNLEAAGQAIEVQGDSRTLAEFQAPAPDLQQLVELRGSYDKITPEDWAAFDRATADYHACRRELLADELARSFKKHTAARIARASAGRRRGVPANMSNQIRGENRHG